MQEIIQYLDQISHEAVVFVIAMLPLAELRLAIPVGVSLGLPAWYATVIAIAGSMVPVPFLLLLFRPVIKLFHKTKIGSRFATWLTDRAESGRKKVIKYKRLGLFVFVAIPLPTTGVWTGSAAAALMDMRLRDVFVLIFLGNCVAATIMMLLSHTAFNVF